MAVSAFACVLLPASAQTLYKLIDKNGKVTYSESAPKDFDGKVIRVDIDPKANTATLPKARPPEEREAAREASRAATDQVRAARARVDAARKALQHARDNPREDEVARVGIKGGGTRPQPTEAYQKRLAQLESELQEAESDLQKLERR
ncbi:MAG TPA: DUF4124 domain-containing protein [Usitatibacter sp.]|nr:DUF4124 domain-containing protein [Usitatibacter sp.]